MAVMSLLLAESTLIEARGKNSPMKVVKFIPLAGR